MLPFITDSVSAAEFVMLIIAGVMGLSHLLRPAIWTKFFNELADRGTSGIIAHSFLSISAVVIILPFHNVWWGPGLIVTLWGWAMFAKVLLGLVVSPNHAVRSLEMSRRGDNGFRVAGIVMLAVAASAGWALFA